MPLESKNLHGRDAAAVGYRLTLTRRAFGSGQQAFAEMADINASAYNQYERGKRLISVSHAVKLVDAYHITLDWIYLGDPQALRVSLWQLIQGLAEHSQ